MLNIFLTTALEMIILLDILGVVIYFVVSGIVRAKRQPSDQPAVPASAGMTPCPVGPPVYTAFPCNASYVSTSSPAVTPSRNGWLGLRNLKDRITRRTDPEVSRTEDTGIEAEQHRIGMILNSFKEDV